MSWTETWIRGTLAWIEKKEKAPTPIEAPAPKFQQAEQVRLKGSYKSWSTPTCKLPWDGPLKIYLNTKILHLAEELAGRTEDEFAFVLKGAFWTMDGVVALATAWIPQQQVSVGGVRVLETVGLSPVLLILEALSRELGGEEYSSVGVPRVLLGNIGFLHRHPGDLTEFSSTDHKYLTGQVPVSLLYTVPSGICNATAFLPGLFTRCRVPLDRMEVFLVPQEEMEEHPLIAQLIKEEEDWYGRALLDFKEKVKPWGF